MRFLRYSVLLYLSPLKWCFGNIPKYTFQDTGGVNFSSVFWCKMRRIRIIFSPLFLLTWSVNLQKQEFQNLVRSFKEIISTSTFLLQPSKFQRLPRMHNYNFRKLFGNRIFAVIKITFQKYSRTQINYQAAIHATKYWPTYRKSTYENIKLRNLSPNSKFEFRFGIISSKSAFWTHIGNVELKLKISSSNFG